MGLKLISVNDCFQSARPVLVVGFKADVPSHIAPLYPWAGAFCSQLQTRAALTPNRRHSNLHGRWVATLAETLRRGWDSNPRGRVGRPGEFKVRCLRPLDHPSKGVATAKLYRLAVLLRDRKLIVSRHGKWFPA